MKFNDRSMALLGVPDLPLNAFVRKASGGITPQGGGSTTNTTTQSTELPPWLKQYAEKGLKSAAELTSQPYQAFEGERIAGFSPLQTQTQEAAAKMAPTTTTGGTFDQGAAGQYMNPYMQSVVDIQKREAQRGADIAGTQRGAQAAQAGAFGGSRQAIMDAEAARNLATQQGDIQAQGSNLAFQQAQQQFNADQERRLRAEGQGFQQGMDINRLQNAYGAQQQALRQQGLTQSYEDFQRQQQDPYSKLSFMSSMLRGTPGMTSTTTGTTPNPSFLQTAGSLATGAYGLSKFMAEGGSVDSQQNVERIVDGLQDPQLDQAEKAAKARGDREQLEAIETEKAARASMRQGLASLPVDMDKMMPTAASMARGGIVAFNGEEDSYVTSASEWGKSGDPDEDIGYPSLGNADMFAKGNAGMLKSAEDIQNAKYNPYTPEMRAAQIKRTRAELMEGTGPSPYDAQRKEIEQMKADSAKNLEQGKGLAALRAASAMLQGSNAIRGLAAGASEFGSSYGEAVRADQAQKRALQSMQINLADAERKERMGLNKEAIAAANQAQKDQHAAQVFGVDKAKALSVVYRGMAAANRPGAAAKVPLPPKLAEQLAAAEIAFEKNPNDPDAKANVMGLRRAAAATRTSFSTAEAGPGKRADTAAALTQTAKEKEAERDAKEEAAIDAAIKPLRDPDYLAAMGKGDKDGMAAAITRLREQARKDRQAAVVNKSATPTTAPTPIPPNATAATLVDGKIYSTNRGPATWNAATNKFVPVSQ